MIEWVKENRPYHTAKELTSIFNKQFGTNHSVEAIRSLLKNYQLSDVGYERAYTPEQKAWLIKEFESYNRIGDLKDAFNKQFDQNRTWRAIQSEIKRLRLTKQPHTEYAPEMIEWLKENRPYYSVETLTDEFNNRFNTNLTPAGIKSTIYRYQIANVGKGYKYERTYTPEQKAWLIKEYESYANNRDLTNAFNKQFNQNRTLQAMRGEIKRLRLTKQPYTEYTPEMIEWLKDNRPYYTVGMLTDKFNNRFNTNLTPATIRSTIHRYQITNVEQKRRSTNITTSDHPDPHSILFKSSNEDVNQWIKAQENPEISIKMLIKNYISTYGMTDVFDQSFQFAGQVKTANEPPVTKPILTNPKTFDSFKKQFKEQYTALDFCIKCVEGVKWITGAAIKNQRNPIMIEIGKATTEIHREYNSNKYPGIPASDIILVINDKLKSSTYEAIIDIGEVAASRSELSPIAAVMDQWIRQAFKKQLKKSV